MIRLKKLIVISLEKLCWWADNVYLPYRFEGQWHFGNGMLGCYYLNLANRSVRLDDKWGTGVWEKDVPREGDG